jgi:hypothetical protein
MASENLNKKIKKISPNLDGRVDSDIMGDGITSKRKEMK